MGKIVKLKNANNENTYPITKAEAVYIQDGQTTLKDYLDAMAITKTAGPAQIITFDDGADNIPVKSLILNIEPYQEGEGDPSPENIRPITGYNKVNITRTGRNLLPNYATTTTISGVTFTINEDKTITANGKSTAWTPLVLGTNVIKAVTYILSFNVPNYNYNYYISMIDENNSAIGSTTNDSYTFTLEKDTRITFRVFARPNVTLNTITGSPLLRLASDENAVYEPYQGETYQITFPSSAGTVYGGSLDITNGELVVDKAAFALNGADNWNKSSTYQGSFYLAASVFNFKRKSANGSIICSHAKYTDTISASTYTYGNCALDNSVNLFLGTADMTVSEFKTWLSEQYNAGAPVVVCGLLATPLTYQLTPTEVTTLLGDNTIWMDADETLQVTYKADLATYIANAISSSNS